VPVTYENWIDIDWAQIKKDFDLSLARHEEHVFYHGTTETQTMLTTDKILDEAADTFRKRFPVYGKNAPKIGGAMAAMFPEGITLRTPEDFTRFYLLIMVITKLSRYVNNFTNGGHKDSLVDAAVYAAMLQSEDENGKEGT